jgi:hypothetical protein
MHSGVPLLSGPACLPRSVVPSLIAHLLIRVLHMYSLGGNDPCLADNLPLLLPAQKLGRFTVHACTPYIGGALPLFTGFAGVGTRGAKGGRLLVGVAHACG